MLFRFSFSGKVFFMDLDVLVYSDILTSNVAIWQQAVFVGILIVGSSALVGLGFLAVVKIFTAISR